MSDERSQLAPGLLVMVVGIMLITRSVTQDDTGRTLIDRILGKPAAATAVQSTAGGGYVSPSAQGRNQTAANQKALKKVPGFRPAKTPAGRQKQSNVFGPHLPSVPTLLGQP